MKNDELDILIYDAQAYNWKAGSKYYNGYVEGKGLDVTKRIVKAREKLIKYIKEEL